MSLRICLAMVASLAPVRRAICRNVPPCSRYNFINARSLPVNISARTRRRSISAARALAPGFLHLPFALCSTLSKSTRILRISTPKALSLTVANQPEKVLLHHHLKKADPLLSSSFARPESAIRPCIVNITLAYMFCIYLTLVHFNISLNICKYFLAIF